MQINKNYMAIENKYELQETNQNNNKAQQKKSDYQYFSSLEHYRPIFYSGKGTPIFFENDHWCKSFSCVAFFDVIFVICVIMFFVFKKDSTYSKITNPSREEIIKYRNASNSLNEIDSDTNHAILISSIVCFIIINLSYFLCQFLNPGLDSPKSIAESIAMEISPQFCQYCQNYKTKDMSHCKDCKICVWGLDHHCGFFNKCIGGWQKWGFYLFLTALFGGFVIIIVCMGFLAMEL